MDLGSLKKEQLKNYLFNLMDDVAYYLSNDSDIDKFLDQTELFNEWEKVLPDSEYPIFVMAVLNNIRREAVLDTIINAILDLKESDEKSNRSEKKAKISHPMFDQHPFS